MESVYFSSWGGQVTGSLPGITSPDQPLPFSAWSFSAHSDHEEQPLKALIGWDGLVIWSSDVNVVDLCHQYIQTVKQQSCGQCSTCPTGMNMMSTLLEKICNGQGESADLDHLKNISRTVLDTGRCGIGQLGPLPVAQALEHFEPEFRAAIDQGTPITPGQYHSKVTAPCIEACPLKLDIPQYVDYVRNGQFKKSLDLICSRLPLPGVLGRACFHPCENQCRRQLRDQSVDIRGLKRFVADSASKKNEALIFPEQPSEVTGSVAIIGAGPAGLACACHLARRGHQVVIFEQLPEPGGMVATGIPDYRVPRSILQDEVEAVRKLGVQIQYNTIVGKDVLITDLEKDFDALFIAIGAHNSSAMRVEGEHEGYQGYIPGVRYLADINNGKDPYPEGRKVAVIGGGNVAMDCVRTAVRHHKDSVNLLYRRTRQEMPADPHEITGAEEENVQFHFLIAPQKIMAENDRVVGLQCLKMELGEPDDSGRRRPVPIKGSEFVLECDTLVSAIGQKVNLELLNGVEDIETTDWNTIVVNPVTQETSRKGVFCGGDCENDGPDALVTAAACGLRGAENIDRLINGQPLGDSLEEGFDRLFSQLKVFDPNEALYQGGKAGRPTCDRLPIHQRMTSFDEIESGYTPAQAREEASRCLRCYRVLTVAV